MKSLLGGVMCLTTLAQAAPALYSAIYLLQTFTSKAHNNLQGVFPITIGFDTFGHHLLIGDHAKKVAKDDKANHGWGNHPVNCCVPLK